MMEGRGVVYRDAPEGGAKGFIVCIQRRRQLHNTRARNVCSSRLTSVGFMEQWLLCVRGAHELECRAQERALVYSKWLCRSVRDEATPLCQLLLRILPAWSVIALPRGVISSVQVVRSSSAR